MGAAEGAPGPSARGPASAAGAGGHGGPEPFPELREQLDASLRSVLARELAGVGAGPGEAVRHAVLGPGKRIRPLLLLAAHEAAGGRPSPAILELASSVELVHAYSLVHDDLPCMDDDVLRRGRATLHVRFGAHAAVFAGAALMPAAARAVWRGGHEAGLDEGRVRRLLRILTRASGGSGMVGGQLRDLRAEGRSVGRGELERIHRGKTAALLSAAARMGGVAAGAAEPVVERLGRFGERLGLAFQAVDDILDVTGDARELGKSGGRDRALGKATYPSVLGLEEAERVSRALADDARRELETLDGAGALDALASYVVERQR